MSRFCSLSSIGIVRRQLSLRPLCPPSSASGSRALLRALSSTCGTDFCGSKNSNSSSSGSGSSGGSSSGNSSGSSKPKLKIKRQESSSGVMPPFGDDELDKDKDKDNKDGKAAICDGKWKKSHWSMSKQDKDKRGSKEGKDDDESDDDDEHEDQLSRLTGDESHTMRKEQNEAAQEKAKIVTVGGAVANVALAVSKGIIGLSVNSTGLIADAANSMGDVLCDGVVYYTLKEARKKATPDRPWGRGKVESIGALSVGGLLLFTGLGIGYSAIMAGAEILNFSAVNPLQNIDVSMFSDWFGVKGGESSSSSLHAAIEVAAEQEKDIKLQYAALGVSGLSVVAKEILFQVTLKTGKAANSSAVIANAWQHRADAVASSAVFAGLVGSMLGYPILDPVAGVLVAGLICKQSFKIGTEALTDLSDAPAEEKETELLRQTCLQIKGVLSVEELLARKSGPFLFVESTVGVDGSISASAAHRIAELTRLELIREHTGRVANAVVHVTPLGSSGLGEQYPAWARDHDFIVTEIKRAVLPIREIHAVSEVQVYYKDNGLISTKVDILLPPNLTIHQAHAIAVKARKAIEQVLPGIGDVDVDLELDEA